MGTKHIRPGKYLFIYIASIIFLLSSGCSTLEKIKMRLDANKHIFQGQKLLVKGDYEGSLKENEKVLSLSGNKSPGDQALYNIGLIYAHYDNPEKDYKKSLDFFKRLIKEHPQSPLVEQAKMWESVLNVIRTAETTINELGAANKHMLDVIRTAETTINELRVANIHIFQGHKLLVKGDYEGSLKENEKALSLSGNKSPGDQALYNIGIIYAHYDNPEKDYKKSLDFFKRLIKHYPQSPLMEQARMWVSVLDVIEKAKQVDLEIEKKKQLTK